MTLRVRATKIQFLPSHQALVYFYTEFAHARTKHHGTLTLQFIPETGQWKAGDASLKWRERRPAFLNPLHCSESIQNLKSVLQLIVNGFAVRAFGSIPNPDGSFRLKIHQSDIGQEELKGSFGVYRYKMIGFYRPEWPDLWPTLKNRAANDPQMVADGFTAAEQAAAFDALEKHLTWDWLRARYADALSKKSAEVELHEDIECDYERWFPVAPLVRAANGFLCKDPALTALVSLGRQIENIRAVPGWASLLQKIGTRGFLFQALLTSHFARCGTLIEIERQCGNTQDDLVVSDGVEIGIEVKTLKLSKLTASSINRIIKKKAPKVPMARQSPLVIAIFPIEEGLTGEQHEERLRTKERCPRLQEVAAGINPEDLVFADKIQGVIVCGCFVDGTGPVRFDCLAAFPSGASDAVTRLKNLLVEERPIGVPKFYLPQTPNFVMPLVPEP